MQPRGAVVEDQLEDGLGVLLEPLHAEGDDCAARRGRLAELQLGNGAELAAVLVAPRPVQQQVFDGADLQPGELRGAFRADAVTAWSPAGRGAGSVDWASRRSSASTHTRCNARNPKPEIRIQARCIAWVLRVSAHISKDRDLRAAVEADRHREPADARVDVERAGRPSGTGPWHTASTPKGT